MEIWKDIEGFEGLYQVSNYGRVKSLERLAVVNKKRGSTRIVKESIRTPIYNPTNKAYTVILFKNAKKCCFVIANLVAKAFIENPNGLRKLVRFDGNELNDHASNLVYVEFGTLDANYKLSKEDIIAIRERRSTNEIYQTIASDYGVSRSTIFKVCK
jgi:hypothetical protein